ncbi:hypothetical protein ACH5RR_039249 [Cinchona calisaya]|uniref:Transmembrane protein n=1 Tax=Cinchona calisaya TaxID=153742 RepID=A0ABD2Y083_9GENT
MAGLTIFTGHRPPIPMMPFLIIINHASCDSFVDSIEHVAFASSLYYIYGMPGNVLFFMKTQVAESIVKDESETNWIGLF